MSEPREPTNRVWGTGPGGEVLECARCYARLAPEEAYCCSACRLHYDRACLAVGRICSCGNKRFNLYAGGEPTEGLFSSLAAALIGALTWPARRLRRGGPASP